MPDRPVDNAAVGPYPWILHPVLDILFCCGGLIWILLLFAYTLGHGSLDNPAGQLFWVTVLLANFAFADSHAPATYFRIYTTPELRSRLGKPTIISGLALLCLTIACFMNTTLAGICYRIWTFWIIQHFIAQSYGVTLLYCIKRQYYLNNTEKKLLWLLYQGILGFAILVTLPAHMRVDTHINELQVPFYVDLPSWVLPAASAVLAGLTLTFVGVCIRKYIKEKKIIPFPAAFLIVTSLVFFGTVLGYCNMFVNLLIGAFYHGSQYLVVTAAAYIKQRGLPENVTFHQIARQLRTKPLLQWYALMLSIGIIIWVVMPKVLMAYGFGLGLIVAAIQSTYSFHHFILDAYIWKLRDPKVRNILVA